MIYLTCVMTRHIIITLRDILYQDTSRFLLNGQNSTVNLMGYVQPWTFPSFQNTKKKLLALYETDMFISCTINILYLVLFLSSCIREKCTELNVLLIIL
jgi:hypothetical protein